MKYDILNKIKNINNEYKKDERNNIISKCLYSNNIDELVLDYRSETKYNNNYTYELKDISISNQEASGRCWIFAGLNILRLPFIEKYNLNIDFEFSQSYCSFWDKFIRMDYFLEKVLELSELESCDRLIEHLFKVPLQDGGQWEMFLNIVNNFGLVPKDIYDENYSSANSTKINSILNIKLKEYGYILRDMKRNGDKEKKINEKKDHFLSNLYNILSLSFGGPPILPDEKFSWKTLEKDIDKQSPKNGKDKSSPKKRKDKLSKKDYLKKNSYVKFDNITPLEFFKKIPLDINDYISIINDERKGHEFNKLYTVKHLNNLVNGKEIKYLNLSIEELSSYTIHSLTEGYHIWFGANVNNFISGKLNILDDNFFNYDLLFNTEFCSLDKGTRMVYGFDTMNHAMVISGVDLEPDEDDKTITKDEFGSHYYCKVNKWKVINSWGEHGMRKGIYNMSNGFFKNHVYQVIIPKSLLKKKHIKIYENDSMNYLPLWDPMGELA